MYLINLSKCISLKYVLKFIKKNNVLAARLDIEEVATYQLGRGETWS